MNCSSDPNGTGSIQLTTVDLPLVENRDKIKIKLTFLYSYQPYCNVIPRNTDISSKSFQTAY